MKIAFEAKILKKEKTGIDNYFVNLINSLIELDSHNEYILYGSKVNQRQVFADYECLKSKKAFIPGRILNLLWRHYQVIPIEIFTGPIDIYHSPITYSPFSKKAKNLITIHDLAFLKLQGIYTKDDYESYTRDLFYLKRADHFVAVSESTRNDLITLCDIDPDRISVTYEGVDFKIFKKLPQSELNAFKEKKQINYDYFLYVGTIEPRKNLITLLKAFDKFYREVDKSIRLVFIGKKGWLYEPFFDFLNTLPSRANVIFPGYIDIYDLVRYYNCCLSFVYPSLYEGFGLPNLEAMACGAPVISSNNSSIPEIVGETGILIDPNSEEQLFTALEEIFENPDERKRMADSGGQRASKFTWEKCASDTMKIYEKM